MSTTPLPTRTRDDYHATLMAPHASPPTQDAYLAIYDIRRGPKRVAHRRRWNADTDTRLFVPALSSWTLETLRMTLWELAAFLVDGDEDQDDDAFEQWVRSSNLMASVRLHRSSFQLAVELPRIGVCASFSLAALTVPMRAALATLPHQPFPLAAIVSPDSQPDGEREESIDDVRRLRRISETLKELTYIKPEVVTAINTILEKFRKEYGLDDDGDE